VQDYATGNLVFFNPKAFTVFHLVIDPQASLAPGLPQAKSGPAQHFDRSAS